MGNQGGFRARQRALRPLVFHRAWSNLSYTLDWPLRSIRWRGDGKPERRLAKKGGRGKHSTVLVMEMCGLVRQQRYLPDAHRW